MRKGTGRAAQAGAALALMLAFTPLTSAQTAEDTAARPMQLTSVEVQSAGGATGQAGTARAAASVAGATEASALAAPTGAPGAQGPGAGPGGGPPPLQGGGVAAAPGPPPPFIFGFFRDPLFPGPGQRFVASECPIGIGLTIVRYCPGLPPLEAPYTPPAPALPPDVLQCDPWFQYFPTCRRPFQP